MQANGIRWTSQTRFAEKGNFFAAIFCDTMKGSDVNVNDTNAGGKINCEETQNLEQGIQKVK